ncbi:nitrile hydratase subunit beta [Dactylosporangium sucinum]|uniref:Nitrile hydratase subunit beta n=1 Tax=Dactylosporangium sucinum TaxID=1424081 RepID=A0A917WWY0_9ACTN|nr:nitrile hydratase subunit beta [Dactylosporangium sucinum]GGM36857.1 nitrile hydratase [Dactylosporangium sucinum]
MDGIHDLGGMHGFGPIPIKQGEYVFKADWERRSFALAQALAGPTPFVADQHRQEIERLDAIDYLSMDYFEKWAVATGELLKQAGLVSQEELDTGEKKFDIDGAAHPPTSSAALVGGMKQGAQLAHPAGTEGVRFAPGQPVRVLSNCPTGHTRAPRYVRSRVGSVALVRGVFQFADAVAAGRGPAPEPCYTVAFAARALWGKDAESDDVIYCDLWESYLEPA